jgi:ribonuclease HII
MMVLGVDEAGRGPILGPMAIAVVGVDPTQSQQLQEIGVVDSKYYGSGPAARIRRQELAHTIRQVAHITRCILVSVEEIDRYTQVGRLNVLEREVVQKLLISVPISPGDRIVCDGARIFTPLAPHFPDLVAVDHAESVHVAVAAASILAKHERDQAFAALARRYEAEFGPIRGGGYPNRATRQFLAAYGQRYGDLPPEARRSWGSPKVADLPAERGGDWVQPSGDMAAGHEVQDLLAERRGDPKRGPSHTESLS